MVDLNGYVFMDSSAADFVRGRYGVRGFIENQIALGLNNRAYLH